MWIKNLVWYDEFCTRIIDKQKARIYIVMEYCGLHGWLLNEYGGAAVQCVVSFLDFGLLEAMRSLTHLGIYSNYESNYQSPPEELRRDLGSTNYHVSRSHEHLKQDFERSGPSSARQCLARSSYVFTSQSIARKEGSVNMEILRMSSSRTRGDCRSAEQLAVPSSFAS